MTDLLDTALQDLVPSFAEEQPDWSGVVARSMSGRRWSAPPWRRPLRRSVAVAFALLLLLGSAAALAGPLHDLFFGKPAPPIIKKAFAQQNEMRALMRRWQKAHGLPVNSPPLVDVTRAHGVIASRTSDGLLLLWAAPHQGGGECWFVEFARDQIGHKRPTGGGSCTEKPIVPSKIRWAYGGSAAHRTLSVLSGRLDTQAVVIRVSFRHGRVRTVPVVDRYFLAAFPRTVGTPVDLVALDAHGRVVASYRVRHR